MHVRGRTDRSPPDEEIILLLREAVAVAAVAVKHHAVAAHPIDIFLGDWRAGVGHVHVQDVVRVLQVHEVVFAVELAACGTLGWRCEGDEGEGEEKGGKDREMHGLVWQAREGW